MPFDKVSLIVAECIDGVCNSRYGGATFECADRICTENDYCTISTGGPVGSVPSGTCIFDDGCNDCACASTPVGCECSAQDGNVTISCALP